MPQRLEADNGVLQGPNEEVMRCDECRHWKPDDELDWEATEVGFRECGAVRERWRITEDATKGWAWPGGPKVDWDSDAAAVAYKKAKTDALIAGKAYVQDGSEYRAELYTAPDFFCALFAPVDTQKLGENNAPDL